MIDYDARDLEIACQKIVDANPELDHPRIQIGFDGLYPEPGKCFAEVMVPGGPYAKVYGSSTFDAIRRLYRKLTGKDDLDEHAPGDAQPG